MKRGLRRWLLHRRLAMRPLVLRTSWGDFAYRMRKALDIDIQVLLGEIDLASLAAHQETRVLPTEDPDLPTEVYLGEEGHLSFAETLVDRNATALVARK